MDAAEFYVKAGNLLATEHTSAGEFPRRVHTVTFYYESGWGRYDGQTWQRHLYTPEEQRKIDAERTAA